MANVSSSENDDYKQFHILLDPVSQLLYISPMAGKSSTLKATSSQNFLMKKAAEISIAKRLDQ